MGLPETRGAGGMPHMKEVHLNAGSDIFTEEQNCPASCVFMKFY